MSDKIKREDLCETALRLIGLMQLGAQLQGADGHVWILCDGEHDYLQRILRKSGVMLNDKIYGGVLEALDTLDKALEDSGSSRLRVHGWDALEDQLWMGEGGVDASRIDRRPPGKGGIY